MPVEMKSMIADTLRMLLRKKPLDKITVKEIVETCHISRQAFYYHFQDILQVIEWYEERNLNEALEISLSASDGNEAAKLLIKQIFQDRDLIVNLISSQYKDDMHKLLVNMTYQYLQKMLKKNSSKLEVSPTEIDDLLSFYSYGLVGMMLQTLMKSNPDQDMLVKKICNILRGEFSINFME